MKIAEDEVARAWRRASASASASASATATSVVAVTTREEASGEEEDEEEARSEYTRVELEYQRHGAVSVVYVLCVAARTNTPPRPARVSVACTYIILVGG